MMTALESLPHARLNLLLHLHLRLRLRLSLHPHSNTLTLHHTEALLQALLTSNPPV